jgi:hypothetical protein
MEAIQVEHGDILATACDVLVLKYAHGFFGADRAIAGALGLSERDDSALAPHRHMRIPTRGRLPCKRVLFLGVPPLWDFGYAEIRAFSKEAMTILAGENCERDVIAMTMHGVGYGLDEQEAFTAQVAGLMEYLGAPDCAWRPKQILIVERETNRAERVKGLLDSIVGKAGSTAPGPDRQSTRGTIPDAGIASDLKQHIFVAMPYNEEMEDVYEFGIREPINAAGCLCERCDRSVFVGDVLDRIKGRITSAAVVIADMSGANPNVYLEVGYAWGKGVPTLLVARDGEELKFDVKTHRCVYYKNIAHLRRQLAELLPQLIAMDGGLGHVPTNPYRPGTDDGCQ